MPASATHAGIYLFSCCCWLVCRRGPRLLRFFNIWRLTPFLLHWVTHAPFIHSLSRDPTHGSTSFFTRIRRSCRQCLLLHESISDTRCCCRVGLPCQSQHPSTRSIVPSIGMQSIPFKPFGIHSSQSIASFFDRHSCERSLRADPSDRFFDIDDNNTTRCCRSSVHRHAADLSIDRHRSIVPSWFSVTRHHGLASRDIIVDSLPGRISNKC